MHNIERLSSVYVNIMINNISICSMRAKSKHRTSTRYGQLQRR